jgi:hypothetical protein
VGQYLHRDNENVLNSISARNSSFIKFLSSNHVSESADDSSAALLAKVVLDLSQDLSQLANVETNSCVQFQYCSMRLMSR